MRAASSYHVTVAGKDPSGKLEVTVAGPGELQANLSVPQQSFAYIALGHKEYLKAGAAFYTSNPVLAQNVADRWVVLPRSGLIPLLDLADTAKTARCLLGRHGTLTKVGATTLGSIAVVEIDDRGEIPGTSPAKFYFSADTHNDLLEIEQTGVGTAGAGDDSCGPFLGGVPKVESALTTMRIDSWRSRFDIASPNAPIDLVQPPFCGTPVGEPLSTAAQQFLLAVFRLNQQLAALEGHCGCDGGDFSLLQPGARAESAYNEQFASALQRISATGQTKADINAEIAAIHAEDQLLRQAAASTSPAQYEAYSYSILSSKERAGAASQQVRADLQLGPSTCSFSVP